MYPHDLEKPWEAKGSKDMMKAWKKSQELRSLMSTLALSSEYKGGLSKGQDRVVGRGLDG